MPLKTCVISSTLCAIALSVGCGSPNTASVAATPSAPTESNLAESAAPKIGAKPNPAADPPGIHNLMRVSARVYSGSEPHGDEGFASLAKLGVKTAISVDGARPDVKVARKYGIRYVHIPIGYDGVTVEAGHSISRAMREVEKPVYIHCHHGQHRGPAAAAVACIAAGDASNANAKSILEKAGTSKDYKGLWRDVESYKPPAADAELPELLEVAKVDSFTAAMSQVDRAFDNLKLCRDVKWSVPPESPDLVADREALLLMEGLHEAGRNLGDLYDDQFKTWLAAAEKEAGDLRTDLQENRRDAATQRMMVLEKSCKQCHQQYRN